eukprot:10033-Heterococcus_DN1.PRE.3
MPQQCWVSPVHLYFKHCITIIFACYVSTSRELAAHAAGSIGTTAAVQLLATCMPLARVSSSVCTITAAALLLGV